LTYIAGFAIISGMERRLHFFPTLTTTSNSGDIRIMAKSKDNSKSNKSQENVKKCVIDGCNGKMHGNLFCTKHYTRHRLHGNPFYGEKERHDKCIVDGCECSPRSGYSKYCEMHYGRIRRNGNIELRPKNTRSVRHHGYVVVNVKSELSHKMGWVYEHRLVLINKIGTGKHPCHWCGKIVDFSLRYPKSRDALVVDHLDDVKANNDPDNLVPSCSSCNARRSAIKINEKMREKRSTWVEFGGERKTVKEWADELGIRRESLFWRLKNGWSTERALTKGRGVTGPKRQEKRFSYGY